MSTFDKFKVLVADDAETVHAFFSKIAQESPIPFKVIGAFNGLECMKLLKDGRTNLAFIDVNMPGMTGTQVVSAARYEGIKTFVTLISGNSNKRRLRLARHLKVYEYLIKPFSAEDVYAILRTYSRVYLRTRVLIVDGSATARRLINKVLSGSVFNVDITEVSDCRHALARCEVDEFDFVMLDYDMPETDGLDTLKRMIERHPKIKVIMMSGNPDEQQQRRALDCGATAFLRKPFYPKDIDRELHSLFNLKMPMLANTEDLEEEDLEEEVLHRTSHA